MNKAHIHRLLELQYKSAIQSEADFNTNKTVENLSKFTHAIGKVHGIYNVLILSLIAEEKIPDSVKEIFQDSKIRLDYAFSHNIL